MEPPSEARRLKGSRTDHVRPLSSSLTFFAKFAAPVLLGLFGAVVVAAYLRHGRPGQLQLVAFWAVLFVWQLVRSWSLKEVSTDGRDLLVSSYRREARVALSEIAQVSQSAFQGPLVTIRFKGMTAFGNRVRFMAPIEALSFRTESRVVTELRALVAQSGRSSFASSSDGA